ncbi:MULTISPECIES: DUF6624 domain-containing protein [unclassified Streptomyces]|uniref:DUF6624 domain-containing protein n=1 Tax=unclassified Streptomyces TaxID=2593676 RepID=UPI0033BEF03F
MNSVVPQNPDLARELIVRAKAADEHWSRLARVQLADQPIIGRGRHLDHTNAEILAQAIAQYAAWPDVPLVGEGGTRAAWRIALRADTRHDLQRLASRMMHGAVERGTASLPQWAHLYDRCLLNSHRAQCYGTQYRLGSDGLERLTVHEPDGLDARRTTVGLGQADAALQRLRDRLAAEPCLSTENYGELSTSALVDAA